MTWRGRPGSTATRSSRATPARRSGSTSAVSRPGSRYLSGLRRGTVAAASIDAPDAGAGRVGRDRQRVLGGVPRRVAGRMAPARNHGDPDVGCRPRPAGAARAGHRGQVRRHMTGRRDRSRRAAVGRRRSRIAVARASPTSACRPRGAVDLALAALVNRLVGNGERGGGARDGRRTGRCARQDPCSSRRAAELAPRALAVGEELTLPVDDERDLVVPRRPRRDRGRAGARVAFARHAVGSRTGADRFGDSADRRR